MKKRIVQLSTADIRSFRRRVYSFFRKHARALPWRGIDDPYKILVSEVMLQQTQVDRVIDKYNRFVASLPDAASLAEADFRRVLLLWQGLGYNRRALYLKRTAQILTKDHGGVVPDDYDQLVKLPGIGSATASSILAFAFDKPVIFIETNIRTVYIHHFFDQQAVVADEQIAAFLDSTIDLRNPRKWYSALMDYGTHLKRQHLNPSRRSLGYKKQTRFIGSDRQIRGAVIKELVASDRVGRDVLLGLLGRERERTGRILQDMVQEGLIIKNGQFYRIVKVLR